MEQTEVPDIVKKRIHNSEAINLDIGGGRDPKKDHLNIDLRETPEVDIVAPAQDLPIPDRSVDRIHCNSLIPHLPDTFAAFQEWSRVLKPGGKLIVKATHANSTGIRDDADHQHYSWTSETPKYFSGDIFEYYGGVDALELDDIEVVGWLRPYRSWLRPPSWLFGKWIDFAKNDMADELMKLPLAGGRVIAYYHRTDEKSSR